MTPFNATDAIFFGFRVVKRDPLLVLGLSVLVAVIGLGGMQLLWREQVELAAAWQAIFEIDPAAQPEEVRAAFATAYERSVGSPQLMAFAVVQLVVSLVVQGAVLRALVRDERAGWVMGMQLGGDEARLLVVGVVVAILMMLLYCAALVAAVVVTAVLAIVHPALGQAGALLALIAAVAALLLVGVRLSVAQPASLGERKLIVLGSWRLTEGRFWQLLGAYVVLFFIAAVAGLIVWVPQALLAPEANALVQGMTSPGALEDPAAAFRSPGYILITLMNALVSVVFIAAWSGVGAYAYRMLGGPIGYPNAHPPEEARGPAPA